ncbi:MAG: lysine 2,3-aminomutase [Halobacteriovoraceae bacterium]|nr:lysine 2,3-aminomutase [Halobacteriovoraceae bacterium]|tara:strand:+ start:7383 stop:8303 length:921 start_codon:yes stop_codon:yes gene_type:complete
MNWQDIARETKINSQYLYPEKIPSSIKSRFTKSDALKRQFEFSPQELEVPGGNPDPIGDELKSQGGGIIHRYQNRILFTPTQACPINCRYCFRKNELNQGHKFLSPSLKRLKKYLSEHPEVDEVILTGGDPLILSDSKIKEILDTCLQSHIKYVRFHTRTPIAIPERLDQSFLELIRNYESKFKRIFFVLHTNHVDELTQPVLNKIKNLQNFNISLLTQTVLLKDVNDQPQALKELFELLVETGFTPYYLHHPDKVKGAMHFYLSEEEGMQIYKELRKICSGWAIPHYIVDSPHAYGKKLVINQLI